MYYPGSKTPLKTFETLATPSRPRRGQEYVEELILGKGRDFTVGFEIRTFYSIGSLANSLNRKQGTIRKWETEGIIPKATFVVPGFNQDKRGQRRLYSREQILGLRKIAEEEGILEPTDGGKWKSIEETKFKERALELFQSLE